MAEEVVGTAWVRIRAITTQMASDLKDAVDKGGVSARPAARKAGEDLGDETSRGLSSRLSSSKAIPTAVEKAITPSAKTKSIFSRAATDLGNMFGRVFGTSSSRSMSTSGTSSSSRFTTAFRKTLVPEIAKIGGEVFGSKGVFAKTLKGLAGIKFTGITTLVTVALPLLIGAAKTVAFYVVGLVAQLGQLAVAAAGAGIALSGAFIGAVPAIGVLAAALKTKTPALTDFQNRIKEIAKGWQDVATATQKDLFPALESTFSLLTSKLAPVFRDFGKDIGATTGRLSKLTAEVLTNDESMRGWSTLLANSRKIWESLLATFRGVASAFAPLAAALSKIGVQFTDTVHGFVDRWADMIRYFSNTGALDRLFQKWYDSAKVTFGGIWDLIVAMWNILKAGSDAAKPTFDSFAVFADKFRTWTASIEGQNKLKDFFGNALTVMHEVNGLLSDILKLLFRPLMEGDTSNIVGGLQLLRTDILPALAGLVQEITDNIKGDVLKNFVIALTDMLTALSSAGFIGASLQVITKALELFTAVIQTPGIGPAFTVVLGGLWGLATVAKPLHALYPAAVGAAKGLKMLFTVIMGGELGVGASKTLVALSAGFSDLWAGIALGAETGTAGAAGSAMGTLGTAIGAIAIPVAAITAAIAAFYTVAYFVFPGVRKVVDELWDSFNKVKDAITGMFSGEGDFTTRLKNLGSQVAEFMMKVVTFPADAGTAALGNIKDWIQNKIVGNMTKWFSGAAEAVWSWLTDAGSQTGDKIGGFVTNVISELTKLPGQIGGALLGAGTALWGWLNDEIPRIPYQIGYFFGFVVGALIRAPIEIGKAMIGAGGALVGWIKDAVPAALEAMGGFIESVGNSIITFAGNIPGWVGNAARALWGWINDAWSAASSAIGEFFSNLFHSISDGVTNIPSNFTGAAESLWHWIPDAWSSAKDAMGEFFGNIKDSIIEFVKGIPEALGGAVDAVEEVGKSIVEGIWEGITGQLGWIKDQIGGFIGGVIDGFKEAIGFGSPATKFIEIGTSILQGVVEGVKGLAGAILDTVDDAASWLGDTGTKVVQGFTDSLVAAKDTIFKTAVNFPTWFADMVVGAGTWLFEVGGNVIRGLKDGLLLIWSTEVQGAITIFNWIMDLAIGAGTWLSETGGNIIRGLGDGIKNIWNAEVRGALAIKNWIVGLCSGAIGWLTDAGSNVITGFKNGFINAWHLVSDWISGIPDAIIRILGDLLDLLKDAGKKIMQGLLNGLTEGWDAVSGFVGGLAGKIANLKGPIEVDRRLLVPAGRAIMEGLNNGLNSGFRNIESTIDQMVNSLVATRFAKMQIMVDATLVARNVDTSKLLGSLSGINAGSTGSALAASVANLATMVPQVDVNVQIGEEPINDIVDTRIKVKNRSVARALTARGL